MSTAAPIRRRGVPGAIVRHAAAGVARTGLDRAYEYAKQPFQLGGTSPAFLAFFSYLFVVTTLRIPIGTETMVIALLTLPMERTKLQVPSVAIWTFVMVGWSFLGWSKTEYPDIVLVQMTEFAKVCLVMLVAVNVITTRSRLRMLLAGMMIFFATYPLRGTLVNYVLGETLNGRAIWNGTYANPNDLAGFCVLQLSVALAVLEAEKTLWLRRAAIACAFLLPLVVILTASRGAFIALIVFVIVSAKRNWAIVKSKLWVVVLLGIVISYAGSDKIFARLGTINVAVSGDAGAADDEGSAQQRLEIWKVAEGIIAENWLTGVGIGAYNDAHFIMAQRPGYSPSAIGKRDTHSTYLNVLAETGVIGFGFFVLLLGVTLKRSRIARKEAGAASSTLKAQLLWLEIGLYGFLVAGIWGTYGKLGPLYVHVAIVWCTAGLLQEQTANVARGGTPVRRIRGTSPPTAIPPLARAGV